jgi:hypothetical protein
MKKTNQVTTRVTEVISSTVGEVDKVVGNAEASLNNRINPVREQLSKRFPGLYLMTATVGAIATFTGIEQILLQNNILQEYPWLILLMGVTTLFLTGTLYKRLG